MPDDVLATEAAALAASTGRLRTEREAVEARNRELERLVTRRTELAARLDADVRDAHRHGVE
jgi:hypothetical protein